MGQGLSVWAPSMLLVVEELSWMLRQHCLPGLDLSVIYSIQTMHRRTSARVENQCMPS